MSTINNLPPEISQKILNYLEAKDLTTVTQCNRSLYTTGRLVIERSEKIIKNFIEQYASYDLLFSKPNVKSLLKHWNRIKVLPSAVPFISSICVDASLVIEKLTEDLDLFCKMHTFRPVNFYIELTKQLRALLIISKGLSQNDHSTAYPLKFNKALIQQVFYTLSHLFETQLPIHRFKLSDFVNLQHLLRGVQNSFFENNNLALIIQNFKISLVYSKNILANMAQVAKITQNNVAPTLTKTKQIEMNAELDCLAAILNHLLRQMITAINNLENIQNNESCTQFGLTSKSNNFRSYEEIENSVKETCFKIGEVWDPQSGEDWIYTIKQDKTGRWNVLKEDYIGSYEENIIVPDLVAQCGYKPGSPVTLSPQGSYIILNSYKNLEDLEFTAIDTNSQKIKKYCLTPYFVSSKDLLELMNIQKLNNSFLDSASHSDDLKHTFDIPFLNNDKLKVEIKSDMVDFISKLPFIQNYRGNDSGLMEQNLTYLNESIVLLEKRIQSFEQDTAFMEDLNFLEPTKLELRKKLCPVYCNINNNWTPSFDEEANHIQICKSLPLLQNSNISLVLSNGKDELSMFDLLIVQQKP
ncbi:MAG: hypothetical protein K0S74_636 [Chlamydiales bacterium]|jgi:hypothetical protein|nr:hypothetical protein [Chlamydiales bacterium]